MPFATTLGRPGALVAAPRLGAHRPSLSHVRLAKGRRSATIVAFQWGETESDTTKSNLGTKPKPPGVVRGPGEAPAPPPEYLTKSLEEAEAEAVRAEQLRDLQLRAEKTLQSASTWWSELPNKRSVVVGGVAAVALAYVGNAVVGAVDRVPLLPQVFELVGVCYSAYFWWRYVLFAEGRRELGEQLEQLRGRLVHRVDELADKTKDVAPPEDVDNARAVVNRFAARAQQQAQHAAEGGAAAWRTAQAHAQGRGGDSPQPDDGSWLDEPTEVKGASGGETLEEGYVEGLLKDMDEQQKQQGGEEGGPRGGAGSPPGGRSPPPIFLGVVGALGAPAWEDKQPDEGGSTTSGGLHRTPGGLPGAAAGSPISHGAADPKSFSSSPSSSTFNTASVPFNPAAFVPGKVVAGPDMDPCLGWDTEACEASGRMRLGKANEADLDKLAAEAMASARAATAFSHKVDQTLHASASMEVLETEAGRGAGTWEREVMEELANEHKATLPEELRGSRKPSTGEEAATGP